MESGLEATLVTIVEHDQVTLVHPVKQTKKPEGASCEISWTNQRRAFPAGHIWQEEAGTPETGRKIEDNATQGATQNVYGGRVQ